MTQADQPVNIIPEILHKHVGLNYFEQIYFTFRCFNRFHYQLTWPKKKITLNYIKRNSKDTYINFHWYSAIVKNNRTCILHVIICACSKVQNWCIYDIFSLFLWRFYRASSTCHCVIFVYFLGSSFTWHGRIFHIHLTVFYHGRYCTYSLPILGQIFVHAMEIYFGIFLWQFFVHAMDIFCIFHWQILFVYVISNLHVFTCKFWDITGQLL